MSFSRRSLFRRWLLKKSVVAGVPGAVGLPLAASSKKGRRVKSVSETGKGLSLYTLAGESGGRGRCSDRKKRHLDSVLTCSQAHGLRDRCASRLGWSLPLLCLVHCQRCSRALPPSTVLRPSKGVRTF